MSSRRIKIENRAIKNARSIVITINTNKELKSPENLD